MTANEATYSGASNLEAMDAALNYNAFLFSRLDALSRPGQTVLDFGAGRGGFAQRLRAEGRKVVCVEPDPDLAAQLRRLEFPAQTTLAGVAESSVEFAYSLNVLEHIEDDLEALQSLRSRLVARGRLYLYVPAFQLLYSEMDRVVGHHRRYHRAPLVQLVERAGFRVERARYADPIGFAAALAYKLVARGDGNLSRGSVELYDRWGFPLSLALQPLAGRWFGKNLEVVATRR